MNTESDNTNTASTTEEMNFILPLPPKECLLGEYKTEEKEETQPKPDLQAKDLPYFESTIQQTQEQQEVPVSKHYSFAWSVATQKGYKYPDLMRKQIRYEIHPQMEDFHFPSLEETPNCTHPLTGRQYQLFLLADGHGGAQCAQFTIQHLPSKIKELVNSRVWHLDIKEERFQLKQSLEQLVVELDRAYCQVKLEQFKQWIEGVQAESGNPTDPKWKPSKPEDDGCTLVVNLLYDGYLINCNVGDSRTLLLKQSLQKHPLSDWEPCFASKDHTPAHPQKASQIHSNGGRFIHNGTTCSLQLSNEQEINQQSSFLEKCRIGRPIGWRIGELGYPACTTLNLSGTIGDLFFKYEPALLTARPDVSIEPLDVDQYFYLLVMATDGLWDHMREQEPFYQHSLLSQYISQTMTTGCGSVEKKLEKLGTLAHGMADREMLEGDCLVYGKDFIRYDDVTVFVVLLEPLSTSEASS